MLTTSYATVTEAIADMKKRGFNVDFNLKLTMNSRYVTKNLQIIEVHRFEGETSSDDEAVVYGIETREGDRGILVDGYGISSDAIVGQFIRSIPIRH